MQVAESVIQHYMNLTDKDMILEHIYVLKILKQGSRKLITSSHELEASGSDDWMLLLELPLLAVSSRASERVFSMLSDSSSKRIAAMTESNFRDCKQLTFCIKYSCYKFNSQCQNNNIILITVTIHDILQIEQFL